MLLIVSVTSDVTADFLEKKITERNLPCARFNTEHFPLEISLSCEHSGKTHGKLKMDGGRVIELSDIRSIWWRRPYQIEPTSLRCIEGEEARRFALLNTRETLNQVWDFLLDRCLWVNYPLNNRRAESRLLQMEVAKSVGLSSPMTLVSNAPEQITQFWESLKGRVVIKALRRTAFFSDGEMYGFYTSPFLESHLKCVNNARLGPVFLQELVEKKTEFRVTVIGSRVFAAAMECDSVDWRTIRTENQVWRPFSLDPNLARMCLEVVRKLSLNFGTLDIALMNSGKPVFFEVNPNGQWAWLEIQNGIPMSEAFIELFFGDKNAQL